MFYSRFYTLVKILLILPLGFADEMHCSNSRRVFSCADLHSVLAIPAQITAPSCVYQSLRDYLWSLHRMRLPNLIALDVSPILSPHHPNSCYRILWSPDRSEPLVPLSGPERPQHAVVHLVLRCRCGPLLHLSHFELDRSGKLGALPLQSSHWEGSSPGRQWVFPICPGGASNEIISTRIPRTQNWDIDTTLNIPGAPQATPGGSTLKILSLMSLGLKQPPSFSATKVCTLPISPPTPFPRCVPRLEHPPRPRDSQVSRDPRARALQERKDSAHIRRQTRAERSPSTGSISLTQIGWLERIVGSSGSSESYAYRDISYAEVNVTVNHGGIAAPCVIVAGLTGVGFASSRDPSLSPSGKNDTVRPVVAWWMFSKLAQAQPQSPEHEPDIIIPLELTTVLPDSGDGLSPALDGNPVPPSFALAGSA
ncbi:hypothetical protein DFH09DRAFT_1281371 [Mycena vulgaris]|nr:hypothetical protein DFH09DRAFT_1281371 [Mycena vulgaris]